MNSKIAGEDDYAPEVFERARQLVWHYGLYSIVNPRRFTLKEIWEREHPELMSYHDRSSFRVLVLAGRSLQQIGHLCYDTCAELPTSPVDEKKSYLCQYCDRPFDPISTRFLCPYEDCKMKNTCCEG